MSEGTALELGQGRVQVDLGFRDHEGLIASYLLPGPDGWTLVETGPGSCEAALRVGVARVGVEPDEVRRIFVTHIHLDHAGGLGLAAGAFPRATLYAHAEGIAHLIDPTRLIASARRAWGPASDQLWGTIAPVPADRLHALVGDESFPVAGGVLRVLATPGHAKHHLAFLDEPTRRLMVGDAAGVRLPGDGSARPAVPPPDLDLELLVQSLDRMAACRPAHLMYAHFGGFDGALADLAAYRERIDEWRSVALAAAREQPDPASIGAALRRHEVEAGRAPEGPEDPSALVSGYELAAAGLLRYFRTRGLVPG
jgi:glyoxylase-like metal-dependent hydrolase (beta-lactamase superfamily II)